jgi:hypothetical protein
MLHISYEWLIAAAVLLGLILYARWLPYAEAKRYRK